MARQATRTDAHGQPVNRAFSHFRRIDRDIDELVGLCKGILADGIIVQAEAEFLQNWLTVNQDAIDIWPANIIYQRIENMLEDDHLDTGEEKELISLLMDVTGGPSDPHVKSMSTTLPLDQPQPEILFEGNTFCVTGKCVTGARADVVKAIEERGGSFSKNVVKDLNYLVIGVVGSEDWMHTTHGRKIEKAVDYRDNEGCSIAIVSEEHWGNYL